MKKQTSNMKKEFGEIFNLIKRGNFKGYGGLAIKNSFFQLSKSIIAKVSGLLFTILLARFLMPELFGLFSLTMATLFIFVGFANLGIESALIKFVSTSLLNKNKKKAKKYVNYLFKIKTLLILIIFLILIISAKFIANNYYNKPIFLALLVGSLYLLSLCFINFLESIFFSVNKFKEPFYKEIIFQISRLALTILAVFIILNNSFSQEFSLLLIVFCMSLPGILALAFLFYKSKKKIPFLKTKLEKIKNKEKKQLKKFIAPLTVLGISGLFFGYIDMIMLGHFIGAEFIGYYYAAFSLIAALVAILGFSPALFPIFSRLKGDKLRRALQKSVRVVFPISILMIFLVIIFAPLIIKIIYGQEYLSSINLLRILSLMILSGPIIPLYSSFFVSKGNTSLIAKVSILSLITNIALNYTLISILIEYSPLMAAIGASIATILSRYLHLGALAIFFKRTKQK